MLTQKKILSLFNPVEIFCFVCIAVTFLCANKCFAFPELSGVEIDSGTGLVKYNYETINAFNTVFDEPDPPGTCDDFPKGIEIVNNLTKNEVKEVWDKNNYVECRGGISSSQSSVYVSYINCEKCSFTRSYNENPACRVYPIQSSSIGLAAGSYKRYTVQDDLDAIARDMCNKCNITELGRFVDTISSDRSFVLRVNRQAGSGSKLVLQGWLTVINNDYRPALDEFTINGIRPIIINYTADSYDKGWKYYYVSAFMQWEIPVTAKIGELISLKSMSSKGHGVVNLNSIKLEEPVCSLSITSLTGTNKIINPFSGGNLTINGSISASSGQAVTWTLTMPDGKTRTGTGTAINDTWDGKDASGKVVEPGSYSVKLTAQTADGQCTDSKTLNITVTEAGDGQCSLYVQFGSSAHMASGNLSHSQTLFSTRGSTMPAQFDLYYNSLDPDNGSLGRGWSHNYDITLKENSDGSVLIREGNWRHKYYTLTEGVYSGQPGNTSALIKHTDGSFTLTHKDGQIFRFSGGKLASITDRNGNALNLAYSGNNLSSVTDPSGRAIAFAYDSANHLTSVTDPSGSSYTFSVGTDLSTVTQPDGGAWSYTYDANGFMLSKTDPLGNVTSYIYDDKHRVAISNDPEGRTRSITYPQGNDSLKSTTFTEKDGGTWTYNYDSQKGYLLGKTDPQGGTTSYGYDANGNRTSTTAPDGTNTSSTYDSVGNMTSTTDALGQTTGYSYNSFGQVTGINDAQGRTTAYTYDARGNMTTLTDPAGSTTKYEYDVKGNISKVTNPLGLTTGFSYDANGNLATVTDSTDATTSYSYDSAGNIVTSTDPKGAVTKYIYDNRNHLIKTIDPNGNATTSSYDLSSNKLSDTDANGNTTKHEYNSQNQLIKTTDALGNVTRYSYGGSGCSSCGGGGNDKLTSITDANNNATSYEYDQLGRLARETDPLGNVTSYTYDVTGNLTSKTDALGITISYNYDVNGRLLKKTYPDGTEECFTYDVKGNILTASNKNISYTFSYDAAGRVLSSTDSNGKAITYAYDISGNKTQTTYPEGSVVSYSYDTAGRLAKISNGGGGTYSYTYDKLGRRTKLAYPNGASANYAYDTVGRLTNLDHKASNGNTIASFAYTLDKAGNRLSKAEPDGKTYYNYSKIYQLLQAQPSAPHSRDNEPSENYSYDLVGNRLSGPWKHVDYTYGLGNQLLFGKHAEYSYDKNGNLIAKNFRRHCEKHGGDSHHNHHDHDGRQWKYSYEFENRLIKAETKHGHETTTVTYRYDPFGRRIEKRIKEGENCRDENAVIHSYFYDEKTIILENISTGEGRHKKTETSRYVHGSGIDEPLAMTRDNEVYYYHADGLGSIVALTDKKQKIVEGYEYDSFGNLKDRDSTPIQPFTYTGREWDKETGLYYYRARYYDPMEGRFINEDPIPLKNRTNNQLNSYTYAINNPINFNDPSGENIYGNYCGPGGSGIVKDGVDAICLKHDTCFNKSGSTWKDNVFGTKDSNMKQCIDDCNKQLCDDLRNYQPKTYSEIFGRGAVMGYFGCKP